MPNPAFERDSPEAGEPLNFTLTMLVCEGKNQE